MMQQRLKNVRDSKTFVTQKYRFKQVSSVNQKALSAGYL